MKRKIPITLLLLVILLTGCGKGDLVEEGIVTLRILSKYTDEPIVFVEDIDTGDMIEITASREIYHAAEIGKLVEGSKKVYQRKDGTLIAEYKLSVDRNKGATVLDTLRAEDEVIEELEVIVKEKYQRKSTNTVMQYNSATQVTIPLTTSKNRSYLVIKEEGSDYVTTVEVTEIEYQQVSEGDRLLANRHTYTLKDDRVVEEIKLVR